MNGEPIVILLVEDDMSHAEIVRRNFEKFRVANKLIHVTDGQAALDYLNRHGEYSDPATSPRPGAILLDLRLPKVGGLEVLKSIKTDPKLSSIPVVILTTSKAEIDKVKAYALHANSYLVKPVDFTQFTELMQTFGCYWLAWNKRPHPAPTRVPP
jgi:CheY-like chemotaxis protein